MHMRAMSTYSITFSGGDAMVFSRIYSSALGWYDGRALVRASEGGAGVFSDFD
jgi:hypothetical protein